MAFLKNPSNYKTSLLAQVKHIVSKTLYRAFDILLSPCCSPVISNIEVECGSDYNITVTFTNSINLKGKGDAFLIADGLQIATTSWLDSNQVVFTGVSASAGTYDFQVKLFLPTNSEENIGVMLVSQTDETVLPSCP